MTVLADQHGTRSSYVQRGCRCEECTAANRTYARKSYLWGWEQEQAAKWTDILPVRDHLVELRNAGVSLRHICQITGLARTTLQDINNWEVTRVLTSTANLIYAITPDNPPLADGALVDATGTHRRIQGLIAIGWPGAQLASRIGWTTPNFWTLLNRPQIRKATADLITNLYDELWDQPYNYPRALNYAAKRGWVPPLAWDDDTIDDPDATPAEGWEPTSRKQRNSADLVEDFLDTYDHHQGDTHLAAIRLGRTVDSLTRALYRARQAGHDITFTDTSKGHR